MKNLIKITCAAAALALAAGVNAEDQGIPMSKFHEIKTQKELDAVPASATIAMACAKCKSVVTMTKKEAATKPGHGTVDEAVMVHQCPGCGGKMTTKSVGKETVMKHVCSKCGDDSAYCCATKAGEKTEGM